MALWVPESARKTRPVCPAATPVELHGSDGAICGVLAVDRQAEAEGRHRERVEHVVFTARSMPSTYFGHCCDRYTECDIWREETRRIEDGRATLDDGSDAAERELAADDAVTLEPLELTEVELEHGSG